jgi:hypothetical protein
MIDGLIDTGNGEKQVAIDAFDASNDTHAAAVQSAADAQDAEYLALGERNVAAADVDTWTSKVSTAGVTEAEALTAKSTASGDQSDAQAEFDNGSAQISAEKEALLGIRDVLDTLRSKARRRRLLSMVKVNPETLDAIDEIVDDLLNKGEVTLAGLLTSLKTAKTT